MGFLDPKERVQDIVLTQEGRRQLAAGTLEFRYFSVHDDELDYEPLVYASASFDSDGLEQRFRDIIEDTPIMEAAVGKPSLYVRDIDNSVVPRSYLFDARDASGIVPTLSIAPAVTSSLIQVDQASIIDEVRQTHTGVVRRAEGSFDVKPYLVGSLSGQGFAVTLFMSGSDGLEEITPSYDSLGRRSYGLHLHISVDDEPRPAVGLQVVRRSRIRSV